MKYSVCAESQYVSGCARISCLDSAFLWKKRKLGLHKRISSQLPKRPNCYTHYHFPTTKRAKKESKIKTYVVLFISHYDFCHLNRLNPSIKKYRVFLEEHIYSSKKLFPALPVFAF